MKLRLTSRIVLFFVLLAAVLLVTVDMLSYRSGSNSLKAAAISEMLATAIEKEAALDAWIEERLEDIGQIAKRLDVVEKAATLIAAPPGSEEERSAHAILLQEFGPVTNSLRSGFIEFFVMEPENGMVVASTSPAEEGKSKRGLPYFDNGKTERYLQPPYHSADLNGPAMTAAIPLRASNGRVVAVLGARLDLAVMNAIAQHRTDGHQTEDAFLINAEQFPVTQPRFILEPAVLRRKLDTEAVRRCAARNRGVSLTTDYRGVPSIAVYRWNAKRQLGLIVKIDQSEALAPIRAFGRSVVLVSGFALLAAAGLAFLLANTITKPLRRLQGSVRRFAEGTLREPFLESSSDEVGLLAQEFRKMAARVVERTVEVGKTNEALQLENTVRRRAEEELQLKTAILEAQVNCSLDGILVVSQEGTKTLQNARFGDLLNIPQHIVEDPDDDKQLRWVTSATKNPEEFIGKVLFLNSHPQEISRDEIELKSGTILDRYSSPVSGKDGRCYGRIWTFRDITERRQAEAALRGSEAKFRTLYDLTSDAVMLSTVEGFFDCNQAALAMFGCGTREEFCSKHPADLSPPVQADGTDSLTLAKQHMATAMENGSCQFEWMHKRADTGETFPAEVLLCLLELDGKRVLQGSVRDITKRKQAEMRLQASEAEFRALAEAMPQMVWITRPDGWNIYFSKQWMDYTGLTLEESLGHGWNKPFHPEDQQRAWDAWQHATATIGIYSIEARLRRRDGTYRWWLVRGIPQRDASGNILKWFGTCTDIHESKQAEEELRRTSALLLRTGELAKVGGWELDLRTMKVYWTQETGRIHEVEPPVAPALDLAINYYAPEARPIIQAAVQSGIDHGAPFDLDLPLTTAKGRPIWVRVQGSAVMEDRKAVKLVGACQDITERKRAEEKLREEQQLLSESQRLGHIGSWLHDIAGPMSWSDEFYRLFGVSPDTCTPSVESWLGLMHPDDRSALQDWIAACAAGEKPRGLEFRIILPDGTSRYILGDGQAVYDAGNRLTHMAGTAQDITEHKQAQTDLERIQRQLQDASHEAGMAEVATSVLHNVGNVLNSVNISTGVIVESLRKSRTSSLVQIVDLLREHEDDLGSFITADPKGKHVPRFLAQLCEHLVAEEQAIARELGLLQGNVEHIKQIVAMQQHYATFGGVKEVVNVADLVEDSLRMNESALRRHGVEVCRDFEAVPRLNVEKHKILQILVNLLRNAKYACSDAERTDKRLIVRVTNGEGKVRISVIDNGIGIPPENLTRIFNHGFTTRKDGHGFGLHSGALAAKELGGSLTVHSDGQGKGATFTLELPLSSPANLPD